MSHRSRAIVLATALLAILVAVGFYLEVPFVTMSPGPTVDVLGDREGDPIVQVDGARSFPTDGELRLTTVSVTRPQSRLGLIDALMAWADQDEAVLPYKAIYPDESTDEGERAESSVQMVSSQDSAVAAALRELGYEFSSYAEVLGTVPDGPSDGRLEARDRLVSIDGTPIRRVGQVFDVVEQVGVGETVEVVVRRDGELVTERITTVADEENPEAARVGMFVGRGYDFPFEVSVRIDDSIGGPSAGLVFAMSVYDTLTPGALTDGRTIAGTGTLTAAGEVGPIGGIQQKIAASREVGAELFLVPADNCDEALGADPGDMRLVRADSLRSAVRAVETYTADPDASLPECA